MFRQKALGITARQVRDHGAVAPQKVYVSPSPSARAPNGRRSFHLGRSDTLPSYYTKNRPASSMYEQPQLSPSPTLRQHTPVRNISAPMGANVQFAAAATAGGENGAKAKRYSSAPPVINGVKRPDLAFHPAMQGQPF